MEKICCIKTCTTTSTNSDGTCFYRFPTKEKMQLSWFRAILEHTGQSVFREDDEICSKHFSTDCFVKRDGVLNLKASAIPFGHLESENGEENIAKKIKIEKPDFMIQCSVFTCANIKKETEILKSNIIYYPFPRNGDLAQKWKVFCNKIDDDFDNSYICSDHFIAEDFVDSAGNMLKKDVIPTIYKSEIKVEEPEILDPNKTIGSIPTYTISKPDSTKTSTITIVEGSNTAATLRRINFNDEEFDPIVYLMMKPFKSLSIEEKIIFKSLRKMPQLNISQKDGKILRRFQIKWYEKYNWLIGSQELNKVFCYHCFLFGGCEAWAKSGIGIVKNFEGRAKKHASTEIHLRNQEQFIMLGRTTIDHSISSESRMLAMEHNEKVTKNRHILSRLIDVVCFLGRQQLAFSDNFENETSTNKGNYIELLHLLNIGETTMRDHLELNAVFKGTSSQIQNELISIVTLELYNNIQTQLNEVQFVSIQADETTDVACKSQISIIIRYVHNIEVCERFLGFFDVSNDDKTAIGLSNVILDVLEKRKLKDKLISQTYDGACMMSGNKGGVQAFIKEHCPQVYLQHCYDHQLNLVLLYGAKHIKLVKHFICNLTAFHTFFSRSSLRSNVLQSKGFSLPHPNDNRWNYKSRSINTISEHFTELKSAFEHIINSDDFDYESTNMAVELSNILKKPTFRFLLCLYFEIFFYIDHLYDLLQIEVISNISICLQETDSALNAIKALKNDDEIKRIQQKANELFETEPFAEEVAESCRVTALAIIDTICYQMELRFSDLNKFKFVQLVHSKAFKSYNKKFPEELLDSLIEAYPNVFLKEKLRNELKIVYSDTLKRKKPLDMLVFIKENELTEVYSELSKLLSLFLTIPITPISSEKSSISTLKRIKRFLTNSMSHDGLNDLSALSIEKNFLQELCLDPAFKEKIIDKFASEKNRSFHLMYKKV